MREGFRVGPFPHFPKPKRPVRGGRGPAIRLGESGVFEIKWKKLTRNCGAAPSVPYTTSTSVLIKQSNTRPALSPPQRASDP